MGVFCSPLQVDNIRDTRRMRIGTGIRRGFTEMKSEKYGESNCRIRNEYGMQIQQILTTPYTPHRRHVQQQKPNTTVANADKSSAAKIHA